MTENRENYDLRTARDRAAHATEFVVPLYRKVDGEQKFHENIVVSTVGQLPDQRWTVQHGPAYCMPANTGDWIVWADDFGKPEMAEGYQSWEDFLKEATFTSLDKAIDAAIDGQRKSQAELDAMPERDTAAERAYNEAHQAPELRGRW